MIVMHFGCFFQLWVV